MPLVTCSNAAIALQSVGVSVYNIGKLTSRLATRASSLHFSACKPRSASDLIYISVEEQAMPRKCNVSIAPLPSNMLARPGTEHLTRRADTNQQILLHDKMLMQRNHYRQVR